MNLEIWGGNRELMEKGNVQKVWLRWQKDATAHSNQSSEKMVTNHARFGQSATTGFNSLSGLKEGSVCGVGNGRNILFWDDPRDGPVPLRQRFPRIFAMSSNNTTMIEKQVYFLMGIGCGIYLSYELSFVGKWKYMLNS